MLGKLAFRNVRRSIKDYLVYVFTMTGVTAFMYTFGSLFFDTRLTKNFSDENVMGALVGAATFFIVLIVAWLINYMVRFMLEKRSTEFGIYLLLGMTKKTIARLYMRENILLGATAFLCGVPLGILLQQILMTILANMMRVPYRLQLTFNSSTFLVTVLCYGGCYLLALLRCRRRFRKMNIQALMNAQRQNEEIKESHEHIRRIFFPLSIIMILALWTIFPSLSNMQAIIIFLILLVADIYLFYMGLSAWIICYVRKKKNGIYRGQNLFLLRQFSSKVRTMQFTMGTLTALFALALMGSSVAAMLSDFENKALNTKWPFDVQVHSENPSDDFQAEQEVVVRNAQKNDSYIYRIYTNGTEQANIWMFTHLRAFGTIFLNEDGSPNAKKLTRTLNGDVFYYTHDTYMGLSDYNYLRRMLGYKEVVLTDQEYAIQIKERLKSEVTKMPEGLRIADAAGDGALQCAGIYSEPFSQDGHNGADYLLIVPDSLIATMEPYYSELVADIDGEAPVDLGTELDELGPQKELSALGTDTLIVFAESNLVRDNLIPEAKYILASVIIPCFYIGLVFLCVVFTVLSVHQLSDSAKYKFRYDVLGKIGLERSEINRLIAKQLVAYYLCPAIFAMLIAGGIILRLSKIFITATGVHTTVVQYFGTSVLLFLGIYLVYFWVTYTGFKRNISGTV